jgi:glycosyltransferase involved in cell wall biosynthesis
VALSVLNILPHRGGGAESFIDCLVGIEGFEQTRRALSSTRSPLAAGPSIVAQWPGIALAARRADLLQTHGDVAAMLSLPLLRARPSVAFSHGLHFLRRAQGTRLALARRGLAAVIAAADRTVCGSAVEREELEGLIDPALHERLVVIPNTAPPPVAGSPTSDRADVRTELGIAPETVLALYMAQLEERKDPLTAIRAASAAAREGAPLTLLVVGDGPLRGEAESLATDTVRILGHRADPGRLLAAADIFVMPSLREGQSIAVLEAMRAGLAMVVSDGAGNPEAVGDAGVIFAAGDSVALAGALSRLATEDTARSELGEAARIRFREHFAPDVFRERMRGVYEAVLAGRGSASASGA